MQPISVLAFSGKVSERNPRLLPESVATDVVDADPQQGNLLPLKGRLDVATVPTSSQRLSIYRMGRDTPNDAAYWLGWTTIVDVVRTFDPEDTTERIVFSGSGTPKWTDNVQALGGGPPYPQASRELAMPAPTTPATVALNTNGTSGTDGTQFYVHTFVNDIGWESAPSPVSAGVTCKPGAIIDITGLPAAPSGAYGINRRRIYRTQPGTGSGAASFYFLREITIGTTSTQDDARALGAEIVTTTWLVPPAGAHSLIGLWNGMMAILAAKGLWFCEPSTPYAWPLKYEQDLRDTPIAQATWEQNLLVLTTGRSVLYQGSEPSGMTEVPSFSGAACASKRSVVSFPFGAVWASNEGLAFSGSATLLTRDIFRPEQWRALSPTTMVAGRFGRFYVCSYGTGVDRRGFMIDPLQPQDGVWGLSSGFDACWYDELANALYVLEGGAVRRFASATALMTATWRSKVFYQESPRNFSCAKIVADAYPVTLKVWSDQANGSMLLRATLSVPGPGEERLPGGFQSLGWQFEITAPNAVQAVHLAERASDLRGG